MASDQELNFVLRFKSEANATLKTFGEEIKKIGQVFKEEAVHALAAAKAKDEAAKSADKAGKGLKDAAGSAAILAQGLRQLQVVIGTVAIGALFKQLVDGVTEAEQAQARLDNVLKTTGNRFDTTTKDLTEYAEALSKLTGVSTESIQTAQAALLGFGNLTAESFEKAQTVALDLAATMGTDVVNASKLLGKALNDAGQSVKQLESIGVKFSSAQKEQIQLLKAAGLEAEAQAIILEEVGRVTAGMAQTMRGTLGPTIKEVFNALGDLTKEFGAGLSPALKATAENMITLIRANKEAAASFGRDVGEAIKGLPDAIKRIQDNWQNLMALVGGALTAGALAAVIGLGGAFVALVGPMAALGAALAAVGGGIAAYIALSNNAKDATKVFEENEAKLAKTEKELIDLRERRTKAEAAGDVVSAKSIERTEKLLTQKRDALKLAQAEMATAKQQADAEKSDIRTPAEANAKAGALALQEAKKNLDNYRDGVQAVRESLVPAVKAQKEFDDSMVKLAVSAGLTEKQLRAYGVSQEAIDIIRRGQASLSQKEQDDLKKTPGLYEAINKAVEKRSQALQASAPAIQQNIKALQDEAAAIRAAAGDYVVAFQVEQKVREARNRGQGVSDKDREALRLSVIDNLNAKQQQANDLERESIRLIGMSGEELAVKQAIQGKGLELAGREKELLETSNVARERYNATFTANLAAYEKQTALIGQTKEAQDAYNLALTLGINPLTEQAKMLEVIRVVRERTAADQKNALRDYEIEEKSIRATTTALGLERAERETMMMIIKAEADLRRQTGNAAAQLSQEQIDAIRRVRAAQEDQLQYTRSFGYGLQEAWRQWADDATNYANMARSAFNSFTSGAEQMLTQFFTTGKVNWKQFADMAIQQLVRISIQMATSLFAGGMGGGRGGGGGGGLFGMLGGLLGGLGGAFGGGGGVSGFGFSGFSGGSFDYSGDMVSGFGGAFDWDAAAIGGYGGSNNPMDYGWSPGAGDMGEYSWQVGNGGWITPGYNGTPFNAPRRQWWQGWNRGGVMSRGRVKPMAGGGVFDKPTTLPMADGGSALVREMGRDEGLFPLTRASNGDLAVKAIGGDSKPSLVLNIDARGAQAGVEETIRRVVYNEIAPNIVQWATQASMTSVKTEVGRGGSYSKSIRKGNA